MKSESELCKKNVSNFNVGSVYIKLYTLKVFTEKRRLKRKLTKDSKVSFHFSTNNFKKRKIELFVF